MAARPANQASGSGTVPVKVKAGKPKTAQARWDANKSHTKSYADHIAAVKARGSGGAAAPAQDLTTPPSYAQALQEANAAGDAQYGPQVTAARQQVANVAPWFQEHMARVAGYAQAAQQQAAPVVAGAQTFQDNTGSQMPAGLDPNSEAGKAAAMAAQGRQALAALGTQALQTNAQSTQDYFGGERAAAAKQLPQAQQAAAQNLASAEGQRGAAVTTYLTGARQNAQNYAIAQGTLGANVANQTADNANQAASIVQSAKDKRAARVVTKRGQDKSAQNAADRTAAANSKTLTTGPYAGYSQDQINRHSQTWRDRMTNAYNTKGGDNPKDVAKHQAAIDKATGTAKVKVQDIMDAWARGARSPAPTPKDKNATRPATRDELRNALGSKFGGTWVAIMERVRAKQPLTPAQIDYLHSTDPNLRIPKEWLPQKPNIASGTGNPSSSSGTGLG